VTIPINLGIVPTREISFRRAGIISSNRQLLLYIDKIITVDASAWYKLLYKRRILFKNYTENGHIVYWITITGKEVLKGVWK